MSMMQEGEQMAVNQVASVNWPCTLNNHGDDDDDDDKQYNHLVCCSVFFFYVDTTANCL
jgi:hypothetical protein